MVIIIVIENIVEVVLWKRLNTIIIIGIIIVIPSAIIKRMAKFRQV